MTQGTPEAYRVGDRIQTQKLEFKSTLTRVNTDVMVRFLLVRVIPMRTTISADISQVLKDTGAPLISQQNFDYRCN